LGGRYEVMLFSKDFLERMPIGLKGDKATCCADLLGLENAERT
jgi:hypothetical protein